MLKLWLWLAPTLRRSRCPCIWPEPRPRRSRRGAADTRGRTSAPRWKSSHPIRACSVLVLRGVSCGWLSTPCARRYANNADTGIRSVIVPGASRALLAPCVWACGRGHAYMHGGGWWWVVGTFLTLFGRTAEIMVKFDPKCSLETHHDRLVFYGDKQGTRVLRTYAAWLLQPC